jgi:hypothetical protein
MNFMAHLPHYAQLEEDYAGTARMIQVLSAYYELPSGLAPTRRAERQYQELNNVVDRDPDIKGLVGRLESHYDTTYEVPGSPEQEGKPATTVELSPEIERFLRGLDPGAS